MATAPAYTSPRSLPSFVVVVSLLSIYSTHVVTPTGWTVCTRANGSAQWEGGNVSRMMPSSQLQCTATVASSSCRIAAKGSPVGALVLLSSLWFVASSSPLFVVVFFPLPRGSRGDVKKGEQGRHQKLATNKRTRTEEVAVPPDTGAR